MTFVPARTEPSVPSTRLAGLSMPDSNFAAYRVARTECLDGSAHCSRTGGASTRSPARSTWDGSRLRSGASN
eukprot:5205456-Prymnesium_polylepis.3